MTRPIDELDIGISSLDAGTEEAGMKVIGITVSPPPECEVINPAAFGLREEMQQRVVSVVQGSHCKVFLPPAPEEADSCELPDPVELESYITHNGVLFVLANVEGYSLQQGQLLYDAVRDACGRYPGAKVSALGIDFMPIAQEGKSRVQIKIEGETLKIYIWDGQVQATNEVRTITLHEGELAQINRQLKILQREQVMKKDKGEETTVDMDAFIKQPKETSQQPQGCNIAMGGIEFPQNYLLLLMALYKFFKSRKPKKGFRNPPRKKK